MSLNGIESSSGALICTTTDGEAIGESVIATGSNFIEVKNIQGNFEFKNISKSIAGSSTTTPYKLLTSADDSDATASSTYSSWAPWKAFNGSSSNAWSSNGGMPSWVTLHVPGGKVFSNDVKITSFDIEGETPVNFSIDGSLDNSSFTQLLSITGADFGIKRN